MNRGKQIKRERIEHLLRNIISSELLNFQHNNLITLSRVELSPDMSNANFFITVFGDKSVTEIIEELNNRKGYFRKVIAKKLNLRYTPSLKFKEEKNFLNRKVKAEETGESTNEQRSKRDS